MAILRRAMFGAPGRSGCPAVALLKRDKPSRFVFPITALRLTPISRAICPHESPASIRFLRACESIDSGDLRHESNQRLRAAKKCECRIDSQALRSAMRSVVHVI